MPSSVTSTNMSWKGKGHSRRNCCCLGLPFTLHGKMLEAASSLGDAPSFNGWVGKLPSDTLCYNPKRQCFPGNSPINSGTRHFIKLIQLAQSPCRSDSARISSLRHSLSCDQAMNIPHDDLPTCFSPWGSIPPVALGAQLTSRGIQTLRPLRPGRKTQAITPCYVLSLVTNFEFHIAPIQMYQVTLPFCCILTSTGSSYVCMFCLWMYTDTPLISSRTHRYPTSIDTDHVLRETGQPGRISIANCSFTEGYIRYISKLGTVPKSLFSTNRFPHKNDHMFGYPPFCDKTQTSY